MPKLNSRPPKYCKLGKYAVVYFHGKIHYLGRHGSPESKVAYSRFVAEIQANPVFLPSKEEKRITVRELAAEFLDHAKADMDSTHYTHYRVVVLDYRWMNDGWCVQPVNGRGRKLLFDSDSVDLWIKNSQGPQACTPPVTSSIKRKQQEKDYEIRQQRAASILATHEASRGSKKS